MWRSFVALAIGNKKKQLTAQKIPFGMMTHYRDEGRWNHVELCSQTSHISICRLITVYECSADVVAGPIPPHLWNAPPSDNAHLVFGCHRT
ncbi:hypothetical protein TNCV_2058881 [Trichonephila clavipes]|nr:hypothetical protein TNCV_2058881 [Trichonephila clavipes]